MDSIGKALKIIAITVMSLRRIASIGTALTLNVIVVSIYIKMVATLNTLRIISSIEQILTIMDSIGSALTSYSSPLMLSQGLLRLNRVGKWLIQLEK